MRSFSRPAENGQAPEVTLSFLVEPPHQNKSGGARYHAYYNSAQIGCTASYGRLFHLLIWQLWWCADEVTDYLLLLSGAVRKNEVGIILPGPAGSGKSCLTLALVRRSYRYFSDVLAAIDPSTRKLQAFQGRWVFEMPQCFLIWLPMNTSGLAQIQMIRILSGVPALRAL